MDEYPDEDEEFELQYGDDLELLKEMEFSKKTTEKTPIETSTNTELPSTSRKRTIQELFGDIDDILNESKKSKVVENKSDFELIEHILELRRLAKEKRNFSISSHVHSTCEINRDNLSETVPKWPFIPITKHDGNRLYVRFHSEAYEKEEIERIIRNDSFKGLGTNSQQVWTEAQLIINKELDKAVLEENILDIGVEVDNNELWADLYKPKQYSELLSDESTNRTLLKWIKLWDKIVFNKKPIKHKSNDGKAKKFNKLELKTDLDEYGRPEFKIALLCGCPGLGKTTLAHLLARHAGYNVVEINASDDRSPAAFKQALENATQMRSVIDKENRPNCLIFDEIDGAPQSSIDYLIKFIASVTTRKTKKAPILKRPIICICNDIYVPALRPLRQISFIINFYQIANNRLAERLMLIAKKQQIKTDLGAMLALAEKTNNDIRSCLSVLQFFQLQNKPITLSQIHKTNIGQKDMQKGLFNVWTDIFYINRKKDKSLESDSLNILNVVNSYGDYDRLALGVFENYPNIKFKDSSFNNVTYALDWFCFNDSLTRNIQQTQNYTLTSYLPFAFVVWHFCFAGTQWPKLHYPIAEHEAKMKRIKQKSIIEVLIKGIQPNLRCYLNRSALLLDYFPFLSIIIVPHFRPVNIHLYTKEEKLKLNRIVNIMIDYNLNYVQERTTEGSYIFKLDPNIEEFSFDVNSKQKFLTYSNKQLISHEIEVEKMRRFEDKHDIKILKNSKNVPAMNLTNHLQTLKTRTVLAKDVAVTKDFFGRIITRDESIGIGGPHLKNDIWFKFKEGYSNAVRRKIKISALK